MAACTSSALRHLSSSIMLQNVNFIHRSGNLIVTKLNQCKCRSIMTNFWLVRRIFSDSKIWEEHLSDETKMDIEKHWRERVLNHGQNEVYSKSQREQKKFYVLAMFPYPSGKLHMGHVRVYSISDAIARYNRMLGKEVILPMGWDGFGLPAENAAIERGEDPASWTYRNISIMKEQLLSLGCSFDWNREFATCDPKYYKWTQYLFLKLHEHGLAYQKKEFVNWDPVDKTVLAEEQVDDNGCSWRSGAKVEKKLLKQWFLRSTRFSESLWNGLDSPVLENWKEVLKIQRHWIGDCNGYSFQFKMKEGDSILEDSLDVLTDKPELLFGVTFIALSPEHVLSKTCAEASNFDVNQDVRLNAVAIHPFTNAEIPIFVTNRVNYQENANAHLGVPGEMNVDRTFAERHGLPSVNVVVTTDVEDSSKSVLRESGEFSGLSLEEARKRIRDKALKLGIGGHLTSSKLRDWLISRQRYWGTPIPIIHCKKCKAVPVPYDDLPVELPKSDEKHGAQPLSHRQEWSDVTCPKCGGKARRETDTMDTFVDSSWYFLRFLDPANRDAPFDREIVDQSMPVDCYVGGLEHAAVHLYYARFISHFCHGVNFVGHQEPFKRLLMTGMVLGETYVAQKSGKYLRKEEVEVRDNKLVEIATSTSVMKQWEKMSKSRHNGVDPKEVLDTYGIDTTRLFMLADVTPASARNWSPSTFPGVLRWQSRLWQTVHDFRKFRVAESFPKKKKDRPFGELEEFLHENRNFYIKKITYNFSHTYQLSVAISNMQGLTNSLRNVSAEAIGRSPQYERTLAAQIVMLSPLAPHFASELWTGFVDAAAKSSTDIFWDADVLSQTWPVLDKCYNLDLQFKINNEEVSVVKLSQNDFAALTEERALQMVSDNPAIALPLKGHQNARHRFVHNPEYGALLDFTIPDLLIKAKSKRKNIDL